MASVSKALKKELALLHIKRDSYLNDLFGKEIERLDKEVGFRNSDAVYSRLYSRKLPRRITITLALEPAIAARMNTVLTEKNIPRDSFVNRVLFFLIATKPILDGLHLRFSWTQGIATNPLDCARDFLNDPFAHIRNSNYGRFYTLPNFPDAPVMGGQSDNLFALNTAISDEDWQSISFTEDNLHSMPVNGSTASDKVAVVDDRAETAKKVAYTSLSTAFQATREASKMQTKQRQKR